MRLNADKLRLRQQEVLFIGHMATDKELNVGPSKVCAIVEMPPLADKQAVQWLLGLAQYLTKFLLHLSDITKPLRGITQQDVMWAWNEAQQTAFKNLKDAVTHTPVLHLYYSLQDEVSIQWDALQTGLRVALLQNGQPVAYASLALTPTESRYAQIEKEKYLLIAGGNLWELVLEL